MKIMFKVKGMTCASCANKVEVALKGVTGVSKASVNVATHGAIIEYEPKQVSIPQLKEAVSKIGYELVN